MGNAHAVRDNGWWMYRFLLSPKWLLGHVLVAVVCVTFVSLGLWQLDRHDERSARNALVAERMRAPVADLDELDGVSADALAYRRVSLSGRYRATDEILLTPRSWNGRPGHHVLTALATDDGQAVLVDRGWVPYELSEPPVAEAAPPSGHVEVTGLVLPEEPATRFSTEFGADGALARVSRVDLGRLQHQVDVALRPFFVQLQSQDPTAGELPVAADPPELSGGNHLSYAVQWFLFTAVGLVGYPTLVRRTALERRDAGQDPDVPAGVPPQDRAELTDVP